MAGLTVRTLGSDTYSVDVNFDANSRIQDLKNAIEQKLGSEFYCSKDQIIVFRGQDVTSFPDTLDKLEIKSSDHVIVLGHKHRDPVPEIVKAPKSVTSESSKSSNPSLSKPQVKLVPDLKAIAQLTEFGFNRNDIIRALEQTDDIEVATSIILNDMRRPSDFYTSGDDSDLTSIEGKSTIQKNIEQIINNIGLEKIIQSSKEGNTTFLEAFCSLLFQSAPNEIPTLLKDPEYFNKIFTSIINQHFSIESNNGQNNFAVKDNVLETDLNQDDNNNINNLANLGFSNDKSKFAYMVCNKNTEKAAEILFKFLHDKEF